MSHSLAKLDNEKWIQSNGNDDDDNSNTNDKENAALYVIVATYHNI